MGYQESTFSLLAERLSWWFSRLLRLQDNDLTEYEGFSYIEVLYLCNKISGTTLWSYTDDNVDRFKELLELVRGYVQARVIKTLL
jgi:succinate dehydrogenase flavin-adding protein (antitoxin of CptAB toxin-antitoxin module)